MNTSRPLLLAFAGVLGALPAATFAAAPKVEETVVGPVGQAGHYVISERGAHIAFAGAKGDKFVVIVDGVAGPEFDELLRPNGQPVLKINKTLIGPATQTTGGAYNDGPVIMSVDGEHHAYLGRRGEEIVVVHDGKEIGRGPANRFVLAENPLTITRGGKLVYWTETDNGMPDPLFRVMVNGKPGPWGLRASSTTITSSEDDSRYAFPMTTKDNKVALIIDGKDAGYFAQRVTFTADGKFAISAGVENKQAQLYVNGKSVATGARIGRIVVAPTGSRWAAVVIRKNDKYQDINSLIVDGKEIAAGEHVQEIWFSPDGKHYAAACRHFHGRGPDNMVIDGKRSIDYRNLPQNPPEWSPDSSTLIYSATTAENAPVIVAVTNGKETTVPGTLINSPIVFAPQGSRYAFVKRDQRNQLETIVDGKPADLPPGATGFSFSADASRFGYVTVEAGKNIGTLMLDGKPVPELATGYFALLSGSGSNVATAFILSPDGRHVAAFAKENALKGIGLWLDSKIVYATPYPVWFPTFTPDSKHFIWAAEEATNDRTKPAALVVYADGQPALRADGTFFQRRPDIWSVDEKGVVTFLSADGDAVKRYKISPASDTSVASLIANGTTVAVAPPPPPPAAPPPTPTPAPRPATASNNTPPPAASTTPAPSTAPAPATAATASGVTLSWNDLVRRPEARPTTCTVNKDFRFQGGMTVRAGTAVNVLEVKPGELVVGTTDGRVNFGVKPDETDILAVASAAWSQLTPEQRNLTYPALLQRMDLWPYKLKLLLPYNLNNQQTRIGDTALLLGLENNQLLVRHERTTLAFTIDPQESDIMAQARAILADERGLPGRVLEEFAGKVVSPLNGQNVALDLNARPKYVVMYMGAAWCGPCQTFSPQLVKALQEKAMKPADLTVLYLSGDRSPAEARGYVTKLGVDWPTLYFKNRGQLPAFGSLFGDVIPQLVVADRHGKILIDSAKTGYEAALAQLRKLP